MNTINLNGTFKLKYYEPNAFHIEETLKPDFYPDDWISTSVPEDVKTALRRYGYIDGHYYGKDLQREVWIEEKDWVYYRTFWVDQKEENAEACLSFQGIDTVARVWLNGTELGVCGNMFLQYDFDVTQALFWGEENQLVVQVLSPVHYTKNMDRTGIYPKDDTTRMLLRKSQMNWGWDFCGHCLTTGIWKPVEIKFREAAHLKHVLLATEALEEAGARLRLQWQIAGNAQEETKLEIAVEIMGDEPVFCRKFPAKEGEGCSFLLEHPRLWWPRPYGEAYLYRVRIRLQDGAKLLDQQEFRFGIRTVKLIQERDAGGRSFIFSINGKRLFIRGANWVPLNCIYGEIRDEEYDLPVKRIVDSNLSMIRIWGGGIYESQHFLDLCDENGIMVFQDMMLACGIYPQNGEFLKAVYEEAKTIVRNLFNRTCIVLWSADNELDEAYRWENLLSEFQKNKVNRIAVKAGVTEQDPYRPFLVSSPASPFADEEGGDDPNSDRQGDMHLYLPRFEKEGEYYYKKILEYAPRFLSEFGFSSLPWEPTYYGFNYKREHLELERNPWLAHLSWLRDCGAETDDSKLIYATQFTHAQGLKYWLEYLRTLKYHCGGMLYWKFNDPIAPNRGDMLFPSLMSCVDFRGLPKLAYYYARRAYNDKILAFREDLDENLHIYGCNETEEAWCATLTVSIKTYDGETLWSRQTSSRLECDASSRLYTVSAAERSAFPIHSCYVCAELAAKEGRLKNTFHLTEIGEWNRVVMKKANLQAEIKDGGKGCLEITIRTDTFVQDVTIEVLDQDVFYSDNCFSLEQGESAVIRARLPETFSGRGHLRIRAWPADDICRSFAVST